MTSQTDISSLSGKTVALALSGGVDSAVAAKLLIDKGAEVTCYFMTCWPEMTGCDSILDYQSACKIASYLGLPLYKLDYIDRYKITVFDRMIESIKLGFTPNPDIGCNSEIKFGIYYKDMIEKGYDYVSTGHYAAVKFSKDFGNLISIPKDRKKDQTYYLSRISLDVDPTRLIFPVCEYTKSEVRQLAKDFQLPNSGKADSQGICFIGDIEYREFINEYVSSPTGEVVDSTGRVIGSHSGLHLYTIGQRHGFKIDVYTPEPFYVIGKNKKLNHLIVGKKSEAYCLSIKVTSVLSYLPGSKSLQSLANLDLKVRIRSLGELVQVEKIVSVDDDLSILLKQPIYAPAPGQICAFYLDNLVVASAILI